MYPLLIIALLVLPQIQQPPFEADTAKGILVLVNKQYRLPENYKAPNLVKMPDKYSTGELMLLQAPAEAAFRAMVDAAQRDGIWLHNRSAFRTQAIQQMLFKRNVTQKGQDYAEKYSARPRHSEHQSGLAVDINRVALSFEDTPAFKWLQENAHKYGFILRYPKGKEAITGFGYEPWHYRYVGVDTALFIKEHQLTFEEYYLNYIMN